MRTANTLVGLAAAVAVAVAVAAQSASELAAVIPAWAKPALVKAAASVGSEATDYACYSGSANNEASNLRLSMSYTTTMVAQMRILSWWARRLQLGKLEAAFSYSERQSYQKIAAI